jgi:hypothetical protein
VLTRPADLPDDCLRDVLRAKYGFWRTPTRRSRRVRGQDGQHDRPRRADDASTAAVAAWCVLGVSRLHHLLATDAMTSKSGAGRHALTAFGPRWHPIMHEALRARQHPAAPSAYDGDPAARGQDTTAFTLMAIDTALALGAATSS